jgi:hypothetical protein
MATGYTHAVKDGEITSARKFFESVSRAFFPECRDNDSIKKINEYNQQQVVYYKKEFIEAQQKLEDFLKLSKEELLQKFINEITDEIKQKEKSLIQNKIEIDRYNTMLAKIKKLEFDNDKLLNGIKEFAIEQLKSSISFDNMQNYYTESIKELKQELVNINRKVDERIVNEKLAFEKEVKYYADQIEKYSQQATEDTSRADFFKALENIAD